MTSTELRRFGLALALILTTALGILTFAAGAAWADPTPPPPSPSPSETQSPLPSPTGESASASSVVCDTQQGLREAPDASGCEMRVTVVVDEEWRYAGMMAVAFVISPLAALVVTQVVRR